MMTKEELRLWLKNRPPEFKVKATCRYLGLDRWKLRSIARGDFCSYHMARLVAEFVDDWLKGEIVFVEKPHRGYPECTATRVPRPRKGLRIVGLPAPKDLPPVNRPGKLPSFRGAFIK